MGDVGDWRQAELSRGRHHATPSTHLRPGGVGGANAGGGPRRSPRGGPGGAHGQVACSGRAGHRLRRSVTRAGLQTGGHCWHDAWQRRPRGGSVGAAAGALGSLHPLAALNQHPHGASSLQRARQGPRGLSAGGSGTDVSPRLHTPTYAALMTTIRTHARAVNGAAPEARGAPGAPIFIFCEHRHLPPGPSFCQRLRACRTVLARGRWERREVRRNRGQPATQASGGVYFETPSRTLCRRRRCHAASFCMPTSCLRKPTPLHMHACRPQLPVRAQLAPATAFNASIGQCRRRRLSLKRADRLLARVRGQISNVREGAKG